jgi:hypothetical protein
MRMRGHVEMRARTVGFAGLDRNFSRACVHARGLSDRTSPGLAHGAWVTFHNCHLKGFIRTWRLRRGRVPPRMGFQKLVQQQS